MNRHISVTKVALAALFSIMASVMRADDQPNFAFPATAATNAEIELDEAVKAGDWNRATSAVIKLTVAKDLVSKGNADGQALMIDSLANVAPLPYSSLLLTLEADLYTAIFDSERYKFSSRTVPTDTFPSSTADWSKDLFAMKINDLSRKVMDYAPTLAKTSISEIDSLLTPKDGAYKEEYPTVMDFIALRLCDDMDNFADSDTGVLPFGQIDTYQTVSQHSRELIDDMTDFLLDYHRNNHDMPAYVNLLINSIRRKSASRRVTLLKEALTIAEGTPSTVRVLIALHDLTSLQPKDGFYPLKEWYTLADEAIREYPDYRFTPQLRQRLAISSTKEISYTTSDRYLSDEPIKATVTLNNIDKINLLLIRISSRTKEMIPVGDVISSGTVIESSEITVDESVPFSTEREITFSPQPYGTYCILPSVNKSLSGIYPTISRKQYADLFRVSDLTVVTTTDHFSSVGDSIRVVDSHNGKPIEGATVTYTKQERKKIKTIMKVRTNADGVAPTTESDSFWSVAKGADMISGRYWPMNYDRPDNDTPHFRATLLTDLAIYHPGDKASFSIIGYYASRSNMRLAADTTLTVRLMDCNYNPVDTLSVKTDRYGRATGEFKLPEQGLLGRWHIESQGNAYAGFEVADYKAPTFYVETKGVEGSYALGDTVKIAGNAMTYSGVPVSNANVKFTVKNIRPWWFFTAESPQASYSGEAITDGEGKFIIDLPTSGLRGSDYARSAFEMTIDVTSPSGETQSADSPVRFSLGQAYGIATNVPGKVEAVKGEIAIPVTVSDITGNDVKKQLTYSLINITSGNKAASGRCETPELKLKTASLPSGKYEITFSLDTETKTSATFILWRKDDRKPPVETPLWIPVTHFHADKDGVPIKLSVGSSYPDSYVYYQISSNTGMIRTGRLLISDAMTTLEIPAPPCSGKVYVSLFGIHNGETEMANVEVDNYATTMKLTQKTETFRDKITAGSHETWRFRFIRNDGKHTGEIPVMAVMSDASLNAITPFDWRFDPRTGIYYQRPIQMSATDSSREISAFTISKQGERSYVSVVAPKWELWGQSLLPYSVRIRGTRIMQTEAAVANESMDMVSMYASPAGSGAVMDMKMAKAESVEETADEAEEQNDEGGSVNDHEELRPVEYPLAFFMPLLTSDADGTAEISFDVPNFNTRWQLQLLGYTDDLLSSVGEYFITASKPVMVSGNFPRFLRTGDKTVLAATLYNNTDSTLPIGGKIEVFDPASGKILTTKEYPEVKVVAKGSRTVTLEFTAPSDLSHIGIRCYAMSDSHSDGEQTLIGILPATTPVIESTPFYLEAGETRYETKLPVYDSGDMLTLQYCDNPVWYCVTALPAISRPDSRSILVKSSALFGNALAAHICSGNTNIREAIHYWDTTKNTADSPLISPLQSNDDLKNVSLGNTPWVNSAADETLRMSRLIEFLDSANTSSAIRSLTDDITSLQNADGGWGWISPMKSSEFITRSVLRNMARLKRFEALPADESISHAISKATAFCDKALEKEYLQSKEKTLPSGLLDWLGIRSTLTDSKPSATMGKMIDAELKELNAGWMNLDIYGKATAAIVLERYGYNMAARTILESLRQFASYDPAKGMWYDNLSSGYSPYPKLLITATVLEAFDEILPEDESVDKLRRWLITQREAENWGRDVYTAEVVAAILGSGTDWTTHSPETRIMLGNREIKTEGMSRYTGELTLPIDPLEAAGTVLTIERASGSPAWGAVISQAVRPATEVKAAGVPSLKVERHILRVQESKKGTKLTSGSLSVGDKVRVQITLTTDREIEYVAVTDTRAACLEPDTQLSEYECMDQCCYYREVRDETTNFFIPYLPKGTTIISYDCHIDRAGDYSAGIASAQSLYAPAITAHSAGDMVSAE